MDDIVTKRCPKCKQLKPANPKYFNRSKRFHDNLAHECKECHKAYYQRKSPVLEPTPEGYKRCISCKEAKLATFEYFHSHRQKRDSLTPRCKQCTSEQKRTAYRNPEVRTKILADQKKYREEHPEIMKAREKRYRERDGSEPYKRMRKQYLEAHPEKPKKWERTKYERHKQVLQERDKKWRQTDAGRAYSRAYVIRRRATHHKAEGHFTAADIKQQYANQKGKCYYCQHKVGKGYEVDHVIPLSRGGSNDLSNIVIACRPCNRKKHDKLPHEFFEGGRLL